MEGENGGSAVGQLSGRTRHLPSLRFTCHRLDLPGPIAATESSSSTAQAHRPPWSIWRAASALKARKHSNRPRFAASAIPMPRTRGRDMAPGHPASTRPARPAARDTSGPAAPGTPGRTSSVLTCAESSCVESAPSSISGAVHLGSRPRLPAPRASTRTAQTNRSHIPPGIPIPAQCAARSRSQDWPQATRRATALTPARTAPPSKPGCRTR
jgi:hypothetical protein